ncbi:MAG: hypothetical protein FWE10_03030 [Rikenellaceae bacterium]|nr:hypothetical protein [Rikenellaceae bacterium]MCL2693134.1 hypothetical protein [Rikenellaceae bacterium]
MKTIVKIIVCAAFLMLPYYGFSQSGYTSATDMDVKGVFIGGTYTKAQVEAKWGVPTKYWSNMSEFGLDEAYNYQPGNLFRFSDNGIFESFYVRTSNFPVYTAFSGGIKVGDNISRIQAIGLGTPVLKSDGTYHLNRNNSDDPLVFKHTNGIITEISFVSSI